jgi:hypothetical protein
MDFWQRLYCTWAMSTAFTRTFLHCLKNTPHNTPRFGNKLLPSSGKITGFTWRRKQFASKSDCVEYFYDNRKFRTKILYFQPTERDVTNIISSIVGVISLLTFSFGKRIMSYGVIYVRSSYSFAVNRLSMDKHKTAQCLASNDDNTDSFDRSWGQQTLGAQQSARHDWWCVVRRAELAETYKLKSWARRTKCKLAWWRRTAEKGKKVKCTLVQALKLCTNRTAHRGSRGIALLYRYWGSVQAVRPIGGVEV